MESKGAAPQHSQGRRDPGQGSGGAEETMDEGPGTNDQGQMTKDDAEFVRLVQAGKSRRQAALEAYGRDYAGDIVSRGKRALGEI